MIRSAGPRGTGDHPADQAVRARGIVEAAWTRVIDEAVRAQVIDEVTCGHA
ncbi:hypothetical protein ACFRDV_38145 [Streptomyces fagopyri]|uniref:hypothetical protein n=1 Tax=Streptomyces fagopyri TaxID=2662397 RepID=UPI0036CB31C7